MNKLDMSKPERKRFTEEVLFFFSSFKGIKGILLADKRDEGRKWASFLPYETIFCIYFSERNSLVVFPKNLLLQYILTDFMGHKTEEITCQKFDNTM